MNTHYTYFLILTAAIAGPLALSFDKKVAFYKKWKYLFPAMLLPALFYIVWDSYFAYKGIWSFNEKYTIGIYCYNLPIEEILFFFVVPYCCFFIYQCIRVYFPDLNNKPGADTFLKSLAVILLIAGIVFHEKQYSSWTFIFNAVFIFILYAFKKYVATFDAFSFLISYCIILIPFLIVNGFLTALPVITYNHNENFNTRIYTIPFEDIFYGMLLFMMDIVIYEKICDRAKTQSASL